MGVAATLQELSEWTLSICTNREGKCSVKHDSMGLYNIPAIL